MANLVFPTVAPFAEVERLGEEIESLIETHQSEINSLQHIIAQKENARNATESNLTLIGKYVDTLEERLATFAITRRDIELREQKCKEAEERAMLAQEERDNLVAKSEELEAEQNEIKILLEELAQERTNLRQENIRLQKERETLQQGAQRSRETLASLENNMKRLDQETAKYKSRALELEQELNSTKAAMNDIQGGVQGARDENQRLNKQLEGLRALNKELQDQIDEKAKELQSVKEQFEAKSSELRKNEEVLETTRSELRQSQEKIKDITAKLLEREKELKMKADDLPKLQSPSNEEEETLTTQGTLSLDKSTSASSTEIPVNGTVDRPEQNRTIPRPPVMNTQAGPGTRAPVPTGKANQTKNGIQPAKQRKVPFRSIRKVFAKVTGVHGAFSRPSEKGAPTKGAPPKPIKPLNNAAQKPVQDKTDGKKIPPPQRRQEPFVAQRPPSVRVVGTPSEGGKLPPQK